MRKIWIVLSIILTTGISAAQVPNLVGNWTGSENGYYGEAGIYKLSENTSVNMAIVEQKDRLFTGNIRYTVNGTEIAERLAGAIGLDNKTLDIAEYDKGYDMGTIISNNEIELIYVEDGKSGWASIERLHRIK
jgi:hypothetical protein